MNKILLVVALLLMSGCAVTVTDAPRAYAYHNSYNHSYNHYSYHHNPYYGYWGTTFLIAPRPVVVRVTEHRHHSHRNNFGKRVDKRRHRE